jgi:hypothetical protein
LAVNQKNVLVPIEQSGEAFISSVIGSRPKRILLSPLRLLAREIPTVINEFLDIVGIESQRTSAGSHFHSGKIWFTLSRSMLDYPGNAHPEFLGNVAGLNQLPDGPHLSNAADNASMQVDAVDSRDHMLLQTSG